MKTNWFIPKFHSGGYGPYCRKTKQDRLLQEQRVTAWSWHALLKRLREREQLSDQWNLGNPSVPDSNLTGCYLWPTPKDSCFTVQQQRANSPSSVGLFHNKVWKQNMHPYPPKWTFSPSTFSEVAPQFVLLWSIDFLKSSEIILPYSDKTNALCAPSIFYFSLFLVLLLSKLTELD